MDSLSFKEVQKKSKTATIIFFPLFFFYFDFYFYPPFFLLLFLSFFSQKASLEVEKRDALQTKLSGRKPEDYLELINDGFIKREELHKLNYKAQKEAMSENRVEELKRLLDLQSKLKQQIQEDLETMEQLMDKHSLSPAVLDRLFHIRHGMELELKQLVLNVNELDQVLKGIGRNPEQLATLAVSVQHFSNVVTKNQTLRDHQLQIQLLLAPSFAPDSVGPIEAQLVHQGVRQAEPSRQMLERNIQTMDVATYTCFFPLKFLEGTKKNVVAIQFKMNMMAEGKTIGLVAESRPFIVITHTTQWQACSGILLEKDLFGTEAVVSWDKFVNVLQHHFVNVTKQQYLKTPKRMLSDDDLKYLRAKFFQNSPLQVSRSDFKKMWDWFGKVVQRLVYQRHICGMWRQYFIAGLIERAKAEELLRGQPMGLCLIYFSEEKTAQFVISYATEGKICHYLVRETDTASAKKTLLDFMMEHSHFKNLMVIQPDSSISVISKEQALYFFDEKKQHKQQHSLKEGYDPL